MDVPQDFWTKLTAWMQRKSPATGAMIVSGYFYFKYLLTRKRAA